MIHLVLADTSITTVQTVILFLQPLDHVLLLCAAAYVTLTPDAHSVCLTRVFLRPLDSRIFDQIHRYQGAAILRSSRKPKIYGCQSQSLLL